jgi:hypothetical protein
LTYKGVSKVAKLDAKVHSKVEALELAQKKMKK